MRPLAIESMLEPTMLTNQIKDRVRRATVSVIKDRKTDSKGRGVLVPGGFVLTAAHCVPWSGEGDMPLGEYFNVRLIDSEGREQVGSVCAAEPVTDIAVIGEPDAQAFYREWEEFQDFVESTAPVPVSDDQYTFRQSFPIHVFTHQEPLACGQRRVLGRTRNKSVHQYGRAYSRRNIRECSH